MATWTVSEEADPDQGEPWMVIETDGAGLLSIHLTRPGPVTPDVAENARIRLGAAISAARDEDPQ